MPPPDTHSPIYILYMQSSLLASDPKALTFEDAERLNLKITPDIKFMLQVEYNLHSPKMAQAMLNLRLEPAHLDKKPFDEFRLPDEDVSIAFQRYYLHLYQVVHRKKLLVKERNRLKREETENLKSENPKAHNLSMSRTEYTPDDMLQQLDRKISQGKRRHERSELRMRQRVKGCIEEELKAYSFNQIRQSREAQKVERLKTKSIKAISDRAHQFNEKTQSILRQQKQREQYKILMAVKLQKELLAQEKQKQQEILAHRSKVFEEQKDKELMLQLKQRLVDQKVQFLKEKEILRSDELLQKIKSKLEKSAVIRNSMNSTHSSRVLPALQNHQQKEVLSQQEHLRRFITKQEKLLRWSQSQSVLYVQRPTRRRISQADSMSPVKANNSQEETPRQKKIGQASPLKQMKSKSVANLEKLRIVQPGKLLDRNNSEKRLFDSQIQQKKDQLDQINKTNHQLRKQEESLLGDIQKLKFNVSKQEMKKQVQKFNVPELIEKYIL